MIFQPTQISGCFVIELQPFSDERGWFSRVFCEHEAEPYLGKLNFVQINHSFNRRKGTFRGMHFQRPPFAEGKLIRCISGAVMDFVLDLRRKSPTFQHFVQLELSSLNRCMVFLPKGTAHGFQTLVDNTELIYHHTSFYTPEADAGIRYDDPMLNLHLPLEITSISEKDKNYPLLPLNFNGIEP